MEQRGTERRQAHVDEHLDVATLIAERRDLLDAVRREIERRRQLQKDLANIRQYGTLPG